MARKQRPKRKMKDEIAQQSANAERREWEAFCPKLAALQTFVEAQSLIASAIRPDTPGRRHYSNLGFFLHAFGVSFGSSYEEKELYLQFIRLLDTTNQLKSGAGRKIEEELLRAMEAQGSLMVVKVGHAESSALLTHATRFSTCYRAL